MYCYICNNDIVFSEEISSPNFSLDDKEIKLDDLNSTFKHRYINYTNGCSKCI